MALRKITVIVQETLTIRKTVAAEYDTLLVRQDVTAEYDPATLDERNTVEQIVREAYHASMKTALADLDLVESSGLQYYRTLEDADQENQLDLDDTTEDEYTFSTALNPREDELVPSGDTFDDQDEAVSAATQALNATASNTYAVIYLVSAFAEPEKVAKVFRQADGTCRTEDTNDIAYNEGQEANEAKKTKKTNPYPAHGSEAVSWSDGWDNNANKILAAAIKFKKGDKVRIIKGPLVNETGEVDMIVPTHEFPVIVQTLGRFAGYTEDELEVV